MTWSLECSDVNRMLVLCASRLWGVAKTDVPRLAAGGSKRTGKGD